MHYIPLYQEYTLSLSVRTISHFIFLKSLSNLRRQIISDLTHAYTQVDASLGRRLMKFTKIKNSKFYII